MTRATRPTAAPENESGERQMIEAAQRDPRLFAALYDAHFERVYAYAVNRVRDRDQAEDVTSEVFHQALKNLSRFEWRGVPFSAWLYRIASNAIVDRANRALLEKNVLETNQREESYRQTEPDESWNLEEIERSAAIFRFLEDLPADQRRVVEMRFVQERSIRDIAKDLGRSEGAVKQLQFRALQNLRDRLNDARVGERNG